MKGYENKYELTWWKFILYFKFYYKIFSFRLYLFSPSKVGILNPSMIPSYHFMTTPLSFSSINTNSKKFRNDSCHKTQHMTSNAVKLSFIMSESQRLYNFMYFNPSFRFLVYCLLLNATSFNFHPILFNAIYFYLIFFIRDG